MKQLIKKSITKHIYKILSLSLIFFLICFVPAGCNKKESDTPMSRSDFYFDTLVTITIYDSTDESILDGCFDLCKKYENLFSKTKSESDITAINANSKKGILQTKVHSETADMIRQGLKYSSLSDGAFDISISPLVDLWDITSDHPKVPDDNKIKNLLALTDYKKISVSGNTVTLGANQQIDLGGVAKGYIADRLKEYLDEKNVKSAIINLGGNVLEIGGKDDGSDFAIGIQYPFKANSEIITKIASKGKSIVSSGSYERYFKQDGKIYHHILDPATGYPADSDLLSATIISNSSLDGDCLSTTCFVLGYEKAKELIEKQPGTEAVFVDSNYKVHITSGLHLDNAANTITCK